MIGTDARVVRQVAEQLGDDVTARTLVLHPDEERDESIVLGVHALVWAVSASMPMTATDRSVMQSLGDLVPVQSVAWVSDTDLIDQMSDAPQAELAAIGHRVRQHLPPRWRLLESLQPWLVELRANWADIDSERRRRVACVLLRDARAHTALTLAQLTQEEQTLHSEVEHLRQRLSTARAEADQTATHVLSALERHTQVLMTEHSAFVYALEAALPSEIDSVAGRPDLANGVADWLVHVVDSWTSDALARWTDAVHTDLRDIATDEWLSAAHLVVPPPSTPSLAHTPTWTHRLVVSGALAGGAALTIAGQWLPGIGLLSGGAAVAVLRRLDSTPTPERLVGAAREALRHMGRQGQAVLQSRRDELATATRAVGDAHTQPLQSALEQTQTALAQAVSTASQRRQEVERARIVLDARLAAMDDAS